MQRKRARKQKKIERHFWKPSLTSQFDVCPIPFHMDTYRGCVYNCKYCFARDFITFARRTSGKDFSYLEGNRADSLKKWMMKTTDSENNFEKGEEIAIKERIPVKIGAVSDPFPWNEAHERITFDILKVFDEFDYPVEIQTKNPEILAQYSHEFDNPNWTIAVTLISTDQDFLSVCEPNAISAVRRLKAIEKLTKEEKHVMIKCQPSIYPKVLDDLPDLIKQAAEAGVWAFNTEGLKLRITMPEHEQSLFKEISEAIGCDFRKNYKVKTTSDWELPNPKKIEYTKLAEKLCTEHSIKYYTADNHLGKFGCGPECCGTAVLRDYKIWGGSSRSFFFPPAGNESELLGKCKATFIRNRRLSHLTIKEISDLRNKKIKKKGFVSRYNE